MKPQIDEDRRTPASELLDTEENISTIDELEAVFQVTAEAPLTLVLETFSETGIPKEAALAFQFFNHEGEPVENENWETVSKSIGEYQYLETSTLGTRHTQLITVQPPATASDLYVRGFQWAEDSRTLVVGEIEKVSLEGDFTPTQTESGRLLPNRSSGFKAAHHLNGATESALVSLTVGRGEIHGTAPLRVQFFDSNGNELPGLADLPQHPKFGSFISLTPEEEGWTVVETEVAVPKDATWIEFSGLDWGSKSATILGPVTVKPLQTRDSVLQDFIQQCESSAALLVIDTTAPPLGHETLALRPNNLSNAYADLGCSVVFFPFSTLQTHDNKVSSNLVQFDRKDFDHVVNQLNSAKLGIPKIYICSSFPSLEACTKAEFLRAAGWKVVYECRDDMEEFNRVGYSKWYHPQLERQMLSTAHTVVSVSSGLDEKLSSLVSEMPPHFVVPNGVNSAVIEDGESLRTREIAEERNNSNVLGYVGHLTSSWFDWPLLLSAAHELPDVEFEIVGHGLPEGLGLPANVAYLGPKTHEELREIVRNWRAGLIPFADVPLTRSVDPNKIYEYQAWGLRTLSAPMGMVEKYPSTWVYRGKEQFVQSIQEILKSPITIEEVQALEQFVHGCTWHERAKQMRKILDF